MRIQHSKVNSQPRDTQRGQPAIDPCRLVRQVKQFGRLDGSRRARRDPCRLVRQVKEFGGYASRRTPSPAGQAGRGRRQPGDAAASRRTASPAGQAGRGRRERATRPSSCRTASPAGQAGRGRRRASAGRISLPNCFTCRTSRQGSQDARAVAASCQTASPAGQAGRGREQDTNEPKREVRRARRLLNNPATMTSAYHCTSPHSNRRNGYDRIRARMAGPFTPTPSMIHLSNHFEMLDAMRVDQPAPFTVPSMTCESNQAEASPSPSTPRRTFPILRRPVKR